MAGPDTAPPLPPPAGATASREEMARYILRHRRRRETLFPSHYFADPVWDMLLDLFATQSMGQKLAASSLLVAASVPPSTALRRIRQLVEDGVLLATPDPHDGRRTFIALSDQSFRAVAAWLDDFRAGLGVAKTS